MASTRLAVGLNAPKPSGAVQIDPVNPDDNITTTPVNRPVRFVYAEETYFARNVFVRCPLTADDVQLQRMDDGTFEAVVPVPVGPCKYVFVVVPRENTKVEFAPFTRLGWDANADVRGGKGLVTWPLELVVTDADGGGDALAVFDKTSYGVAPELQPTPEEEQPEQEQVQEQKVVEEKSKVADKAANNILMPVLCIIGAIGVGLIILLQTGPTQIEVEVVDNEPKPDELPSLLRHHTSLSS